MPDSMLPVLAHAGPAPQPGTRKQIALFPSTPRRREIDDWLTQTLETTSSAVMAGPVSRARPFADYTVLLESFDFSTPLEAEDVLGWVVDQMADGVVHINHPRYFGLFNPTPTHPAQCAERIVACFNPQLATATTSPFPVALEAHVIRAIAARAGFPKSASGHFTTGGSEANATAVVCALTRANADFASEGMRAFSGRPRLYTSQEAHLAWLKIAHQTGMGRSAVCLIPTDGKGCMDAGRLEKVIEADLASGCTPILIASTAGTTNAGMIDPLDRCGDIARQFNIWHHVDAAWGGALICSDRHRGLLTGIERADSITIDAHKWLATTMGCGMILVREPLVLAQAFHVVMDCMPSNTPAIDPYVTTIQWSRRFLGLRLFVGLAQAGWQGYGRHIEKAIELAASLADGLAEDGWVKLNDSGTAVLCLLPPEGISPRAMAQAVVEGGFAWISAVEFEGKMAVRLCLTSGETSCDDIARLRMMLQKLCR